MSQKIPRSLEALIKKAVVDPDFKIVLLRKRSKLADEILLPMDPTEREMLDKIPEDQLLQMIDGTKVTRKEKEILSSAVYGIAGLLTVGAALVVFIATLTASGTSIGSIFGTISGTLGHVSSIVYFPEPPEKLKQNLAQIMTEEVNNLPFTEALKVVEKETGLTVSLEKETMPQETSFPVQFSSKGKTVRETLDRICGEAITKNGGGTGKHLNCTFRYLPVEIVVCFPPSEAVEMR